MSRLAHFCLHVPVTLDHVLPAFMADPDVWLGGQQIDDQLRVLALEPAGFHADGGAPVAVEVLPGPAIRTADGALRRLSFTVAGLVPQTRCDLTVTGTAEDGVRFRLRGEFRPTIVSALRSAANGTPTRDESAAVEAIMQPLVLRVVERTAGVSLTW